MLRSEVNSYSPWGVSDADGSDYWWNVKAFHCVPSLLVFAFALSTRSCRWSIITTVNWSVFIQHFSDQFWAFQPLNIWSLHLAGPVLSIQDSMCSSGPIYTFVYQDATWGAILTLDISTLTCPLQRPGISPATFHHSTLYSLHALLNEKTSNVCKNCSLKEAEQQGCVVNVRIIMQPWLTGFVPSSVFQTRMEMLTFSCVLWTIAIAKASSESSQC